MSLLSNISNYLQTYHENILQNEVKGYNVRNESLMNNNPPIKLIYPYIYINRSFKQIIWNTLNLIEKSHNNNKLNIPNPEVIENIKDRLLNNKPYPKDVNHFINIIDNLLNFHFGFKNKIVGILHDNILYWQNPKNNELFMIIPIYQKYFFNIDVNKPNIRVKPIKLYVHINNIIDKNRYHIQNIRINEFLNYTYNVLPISISKSQENISNTFYIADSDKPEYRIYDNDDNREIYLQKFNLQRQNQNKKCYFAKSTLAVNDPIMCYLEDGTWL